MYIDQYNLNISADSKAKAIKKLENKLKHEVNDLYKLDLNMKVTESLFSTKNARLEISTSDDDIYSKQQYAFSAKESDKKIARRINETVNQSVEDRARSFKPDDRGRITLGSEYADKEEIKVVVIE